MSSTSIQLFSGGALKIGGRQKVVSLTEMEDRVWNLGLPEGLEIEGENPRTERYTERRAPPNLCANTPQFLGSSHWIKKKILPNNMLFTRDTL